MRRVGKRWSEPGDGVASEGGAGGGGNEGQRSGEPQSSEGAVE